MPADPGYPEGIALRGHTVFVSTAARFGTAFQGPPEIQAFDVTTGAQTASYVVPDLDPNRDHGLSGIAFDANGYLYVLDTQWGLVRLDPATGELRLYASAFPDLQPCGAAPPPCSPTSSDAPPLPNSIAFDAAGNAYVSDSLQTTIWIIRPTEGPVRTPEVWFQDERLDGGFGTNGIRFDLNRTHLYVAVFLDRSLNGLIYKLSLADAPSASDLTLFHDYGAGEGPDEIAFGNSGTLYVTLATSDAVSALAPDGTEAMRFEGPAHDDNSSVPYDSPSGLTFRNASKALLVNNHVESTFTVNTERFVVFDVVVNDTGDDLERPHLPQAAQPLTP